MNNQFNKQIYKLVGVTFKDYEKWCKANNKPIHNPKTKTEFFKRINEDRIMKDNASNLINVRRRRKTKWATNELLWQYS